MSLTRTLLLAGTAGAVLFVVVFLVEGALRPGYDPARDPVSALALGPRGWIQTANFLVTGALMGAFAAGVHRATGAGWAALAAFAAAVVASGLFAMDRPGDGTWQGALHDWAGLVVFSALPAAALVLSRRLGEDTAWLGAVSVAAGIACIALFIWFAVAHEGGSATAGLIQRACIANGWGWIAVTGVVLAR